MNGPAKTKLENVAMRYLLSRRTEAQLDAMENEIRDDSDGEYYGIIVGIIADIKRDKARLSTQERNG